MVEAGGSCSWWVCGSSGLESRFTRHLTCNSVPTPSASSHSHSRVTRVHSAWVVSGAETELQGLEKDNSHILHLRENQAKLDRQLWYVGWTVLFFATFLLMFPFLSAFFRVQLAHPYMTTGKTIALTRQTFVGKVCLCFLLCCLGGS